MVTQDATMTAGGIAIVTMGLIVVTSAALAASGVPQPFSNVGSDWLWWYNSEIGEETSSTLIGRTISVERVVVDSKAMRKVGANQALIFVAECTNGTPSGVGSANVNGALRVLLKAP